MVGRLEILERILNGFSMVRQCVWLEVSKNSLCKLANTLSLSTKPFSSATSLRVPYSNNLHLRYFTFGRRGSSIPANQGSSINSEAETRFPPPMSKSF